MPRAALVCTFPWGLVGVLGLPQGVHCGQIEGVSRLVLEGACALTGIALASHTNSCSIRLALVYARPPAAPGRSAFPRTSSLLSRHVFAPLARALACQSMFYLVAPSCVVAALSSAFSGVHVGMLGARVSYC